MNYRKLTQIMVQEILQLLDKGITSSKEIAKELRIRIMQVAGVKAWRTRGKY